jgi:hypothetical protein
VTTLPLIFSSPVTWMPPQAILHSTLPTMQGSCIFLQDLLS